MFQICKKNNFKLLKRYVYFLNKQLNQKISTITENLVEQQKIQTNFLKVNNIDYVKDDFTNVTPTILSYLNEKIFLKSQHPLSLVRAEIVDFFYKTFRNFRGNPVFSIYDNLDPVVTVEQNFDSLLVPKSHPSRLKSDCYYINKSYMLRAHTTAHQSDLIRSGLDNFLIIGDVYRRDQIDSTHFPVFHQIDGVRLKTKRQLFNENTDLKIFEKDLTKNNTLDNLDKQSCHTLEAVKLMEYELKNTLECLAKALFGSEIPMRWVDAFFPFTKPSWELELFLNNDWKEILGCGIIRNEILNKAGVRDNIGWAFGLGLERLAMTTYKIPDIRLFWSNDTGFLNQFSTTKLGDRPCFKAVSVYPQCVNNISFWLPNNNFEKNDFYELVREIGGDIIEQVSLIDKYEDVKNNRTSHCYEIIYRHMEKTLTKKEVNKIHQKIEKEVANRFQVKIR